VFEVNVNGQKIYSKKATGQFPDPDAIVQAIREKR
jgi:selT/selW/selH-like putative selenoprotein